jgi:hypothetical protein
MKQGFDRNVTAVRKVKAAASGKAQIFTQSQSAALNHPAELKALMWL